VASKVGHDLEIEVSQWSATLTDGDPASFELVADAGSLNVIDGQGGAKPLSDGDRKKIRKNIDEDVLGSGQIRFRSTGAGEGELEVNGVTKPVAFELVVGPDGAYKASATVRQTDFGITPYTGLFGALKVADEVRIAAEGRLP